MSNDADESVVESYILRLLDECREEIRMCDSKASILFAGVAFGAALLAGPLVDESSSLRSSGTGVVILSVGALAALGASMWLLGLAVLPRIAHPEPGEARYFEEQAQFENSGSLLAVLVENANSSVERHSQQLLINSRIARRKYGHLRQAMYAVCLAVGILALGALIAALQST
ncbi:MAG: Pycsar system effector family protein [Ilumatobacteraceae bacterium]